MEIKFIPTPYIWGGDQIKKCIWVCAVGYEGDIKWPFEAASHRVVSHLGTQLSSLRGLSYWPLAVELVHVFLWINRSPVKPMHWGGALGWCKTGLFLSYLTVWRKVVWVNGWLHSIRHPRFFPTCFWAILISGWGWLTVCLISSLQGRKEQVQHKRHCP